MKIKALEIRDKATFIPAIAIKMEPENEGQRYLLARCGFTVPAMQIIVMKLNDQRASSDPYYWGNRTMTTAHVYIEKHWERIKDGSVIDVEFILKETKAPKISEREEAPL